MKIGLGCDHGGYNLKEEIKKYLQVKGIECIDYGTNNDSDSVDYPIFGESVANAVVSKEVDYGIVCCGTGIGISMAAKNSFVCIAFCYFKTSDLCKFCIIY